MTASIIIVFLWILFLVVWAISSLRVKRTKVRESRWMVLPRLAAVIVIFLCVRRPELRMSPLPHNEITGAVAVAVCAAGIALAFAARYHLGANWSPIPAVKENHELVTSGPYRMIRHPIYSGMILAFVGTSFITAPAFWLAFAILSVTFVARCRTEEKMMEAEFPETYEAYEKTTWALIPYVW